MQPDKRARLGYLMAVSSILLFAASPSLSRLAFLAGAGPITTNVFRGLCLALIFSVVLLRQRRDAGRENILPALTVGLSYAGLAFAYQQAIYEVGASLSLVSIGASAIVIVAWKGLRGSDYPIGPFEVAAALLTLSGIVLLTKDVEASLIGIGYCLLTTLFCAVVAISTEWAALAGVGFARRGRAMGLAMTLLIVPLLLGASDAPVADSLIVWNLFVLPQGFAGWLAFLGSAAAMIGAICLYSAAIGHIGAVRVSLIGNAEPAFGLVIAWMFAGEQLSPLGILGGALASVGLVDWRHFFAARREPLSVRASDP